MLGVVDPETAIDRFGAGASELARLVPRHAADLGLPLPVGHGDPDAERARLFGAVIGAIAELAREQPRARSCIDDLHWARRPTIDLLGQLVHDQTPDERARRRVLPLRARRHRRGAALRAARPAPPARRRPACR